MTATCSETRPPYRSRRNSSRPSVPSAPRMKRSVPPVSKFSTRLIGPTGRSPSSSALGKMSFGPCPSSFSAESRHPDTRR